MSHGFRTIGSGTTPPSDKEELYEGGTVPWVTTSELRESVITDTAKKVTSEALTAFPTLRVYPPRTLLVAMYGATIGRLGILGVPACTNQACCAIANPSLLETNFTYFWLWAYRDQVIRLSSGGGQPNINQEKVRALRLPQPPLPEQRAIAAFLDRETGRIDALIDRKERQIELLQEKRQALISALVTGQLSIVKDPDTGRLRAVDDDQLAAIKADDPARVLVDCSARKPSGIPWLGHVPEGWEVKRLKHVTETIHLAGRSRLDAMTDGAPWSRMMEHSWELGQAAWCSPRWLADAV